MILKRIKVQMKFVGETNCYIIVDETQKKAMVIDPAGEVPKIIEILNTLGAELVYIYLTHCHADHINGVNELKKEKGGKVLIHRKGRENLENRVPVLAEYIGLPPIYVKEDSEKEEMLFSGDTLFKGAWGRVDLPTSDFDSIMNSIIKKLLILPENTIVYPGHGKPTRIGDEKPIYLEAKQNID